MLKIRIKPCDQKLKLIKLIKTVTGFGLKEAKDAVDCGEIVLPEMDNKDFLTFLEAIEKQNNVEYTLALYNVKQYFEPISTTSDIIRNLKDYVLIKSSELERLQSESEILDKVRKIVSPIQFQ